MRPRLRELLVVFLLPLSGYSPFADVDPPVIDCILVDDIVQGSHRDTRLVLTVGAKHEIDSIWFPSILLLRRNKADGGYTRADAKEPRER